MQQDELQTILHRLSKSELLLILWYVRARWISYKIAGLRPAQMLVPLTFVQVGILCVAALFPSKFIYIFGIGNFLVAWLAILPSMFPHHQVNAHWVSYK
jgi:hypothetical protein